MTPIDLQHLNRQKESKLWFLSLVCLLANLKKSSEQKISLQDKRFWTRQIEEVVHEDQMLALDALLCVVGAARTKHAPWFIQTELQSGRAANLDLICQDLRQILELGSKDDGKADFPPLRTAVSIRKVDGSVIEWYEGSLREVVLIRTIWYLRELGFERVRKCRRCENFFLGTRRRRFCTKRCVNASSYQWKRGTPEYNEEHAYLMWRRKFMTENKGRRPNKAAIRAYVEAYRLGLREKQRRMPLLPLDLAAEKYYGVGRK